LTTFIIGVGHEVGRTCFDTVQLADVGVKRLACIQCRRTADGHRDAENRIRAEFGFGFRAIEFYQQRVNLRLRVR
jgi:hypothetical protein